MFAPFIQLAVAKARSTDERERLAGILALAMYLDEVEAGFETRINDSKAARGESPTRLSKTRRGELREFDEDAKELERRQLLEFQSMTDPADVVAALHFGMESDLAFWKRAQRHTHAGDAAVVEEFVDAKARLFESMGRFLARYPPRVA